MKKKTNFIVNLDWINSKLIGEKFRVLPHREGAHSSDFSFSEEVMNLPLKDFKIFYRELKGYLYV
jgi:hypothetical protein